jgi:hypothetical protein
MGVRWSILIDAPQFGNPIEICAPARAMRGQVPHLIATLAVHLQGE